jgi:ATP-dependent RNA helicase DDX10/DBP4
MNILICTPGRLLQHLEETYGFETGMLQMLVID